MTNIIDVLKRMSGEQRDTIRSGLSRIFDPENLTPFEAALELCCVITRIFSIRLPKRADALCVHVVTVGSDVWVQEETIRLYHKYQPDYVIIDGDNAVGTELRRDDKGVVTTPGPGAWSGAQVWTDYFVTHGIPRRKIFWTHVAKFTHEEVREFRAVTQELGCRKVVAVISALQFVRTIFSYVNPEVKEREPLFFYAAAPCGRWEQPVYDSLGASLKSPDEIISENILKLMRYAKEYPEGIATWEEVRAYLDAVDKHVDD